MRHIAGVIAGLGLVASVLLVAACTNSPVAPGEEKETGEVAAGWTEAAEKTSAGAGRLCGDKLIDDSSLQAGSETSNDRVWRTTWRSTCGGVECHGSIISGDQVEPSESGSCMAGSRQSAFSGTLG